MTQDSQIPRTALDGWAARVVALLVLLLAAALVLWLNREALLPAGRLDGSGAGSRPAADDPVARCFAERAGDIDAMLADGTIDANQAALFKSRAEALCQDQHGRGAGPPPPPQ